MARLARITLLVLLAACGGSPKKEPAKEPGKIVTSETQLEILEPITFTGEAELTPGSYQTLDAVAATFAGNPDIKLVEIGVFVLDGDEATRQQIADRRAKLIVDYLVGKQIAAERLQAQGYVTPPEDEKPTNHVRFLILKRGSDE
jgi:outer membrane protein OmpA-like peptidoglycan-associated protein